MIQLRDMTAALQAKVISRLFEPERLVWKAYAATHFSRSRAWLQGHPHIPPRTVGLLGYGIRVILTTRRTQDLGIESSRVRAYVQAYRRLQPHRLGLPSSLTAAQIAAEPLFHSLQITEDGRPFTPTARYLALAQHGVTTVGDLLASAFLSGSTAFLRVQQALPERWRTLTELQQPASLRGE